MILRLKDNNNSWNFIEVSRVRIDELAVKNSCLYVNGLKRGEITEEKPAVYQNECIRIEATKDFKEIRLAYVDNGKEIVPWQIYSEAYLIAEDGKTLANLSKG